MKISPRTAAELALLSETFDEPGFDLLRSLTRLADEVRSAVPSYLGMTVIMTTPKTRTAIDVMYETGHVVAARSSLTIPASLALAGVLCLEGEEQPGVILIVYAAMPGAFVDLAADLGWLTAIPLADLVLDDHLDGPGPDGSSLAESSLVNQAIGALLGDGLTPELA